MDLTGAANISGNLSAAVINATGSPAYRVAGTTVIDASRNLSNIGTGGFTGPVTVTNSGPALSAGQNLGNIQATGGSGFVSFGLYRTDDANGGWLLGTSGVAVGDFAIYQNQGAGSPARRLSIDTSGVLDVVGNMSAATINATGSPAYRVSGTTVINASRAATFTDLTINTAAAPAVGDVWTATSTGGAGSWQTPTTGSSLPVVDTTGIAKGSSDATKIVRFEVDGFTTATTRVLTPQNASYTLAGTDIAQTFTQTQTFNGSALVLNSTITGDLIPTTSAVYVLGSSSFLWNNIHADTVTVYTNLIPDASASANLGGSTKRWTKTWTADLDITGTVTPPSGTAFTGTKTVRDSAGTGTCTLTFSEGIMTGGTC